MKLANRLAFITGGGRGIGRAIAFAFAREGAAVVVAARTVEQVQQTANNEQFKSATGVEALGVICDVTEPVSVQLAFEDSQKHFGKPPDILVNNAGIAASAPLVKTSDELWANIIATNLTGYLIARVGLSRRC